MFLFFFKEGTLIAYILGRKTGPALALPSPLPLLIGFIWFTEIGPPSQVIPPPWMDTHTHTHTHVQARTHAHPTSMACAHLQGSTVKKTLSLREWRKRNPPTLLVGM